MESRILRGSSVYASRLRCVPQGKKMKSHLITLILLILALVFYALGYSGLGRFAFAAGAVFELWFWARLIA